MKLNAKNFYDWPLGLKLLVVAIIILMVIAIGYWWDIGAMKDELRTSREKESELKLQYESGVRRENKLNDELKRFNQMRNILISWKKKIIRHSQLPEALNDILKLGGMNGLHFTFFSPGEESKEGPYRRLPIRAIVVGNYHQIAQFLSQVANLPWIVVIGDFILSNENKPDAIGQKLAEQADRQNLLTGELNFEIYHFPDPNELIIIEKPKAAPGTPPKPETSGAANAATPAP